MIPTTTILHCFSGLMGHSNESEVTEQEWASRSCGPRHASRLLGRARSRSRPAVTLEPATIQRPRVTDDKKAQARARRALPQQKALDPVHHQRIPLHHSRYSFRYPRRACFPDCLVSLGDSPRPSALQPDQTQTQTQSFDRSLSRFTTSQRCVPEARASHPRPTGNRSTLTSQCLFCLPVLVLRPWRGCRCSCVELELGVGRRRTENHPR